MNTEDLNLLIKEQLESLPPKAGLIYGIPASRYLELDERPVQRKAADGIVWEIGCNPEELRAIIDDTDPVDYARRPDGKSTIFIWYRSKDVADHCKVAFRKLRLNRGQIVLAMIDRIFEMDDDELAEAFQEVTGHTITDPDCTDEEGDTWKCDARFEDLVNSGLSNTVAYLQSQLPQ